MAKTFKNRALTIATVGVLSGTAVTLATNGLIQPAEAVGVPTVPVPRPAAAGGPLPGGPLPELRYSSRGDYHELVRFVVYDRLDTEFDQGPALYAHYQHDITAYALVRDTVFFSAPASGDTDWLVLLDDVSRATFDRLPVHVDSTEATLTLYDVTEYDGVRYTLEDNERFVFQLRDASTSRVEHAPLPRPVTYDAVFRDAFETDDLAVVEFTRVRSTTFAEIAPFRIGVVDELYYVGPRARIYEAVERAQVPLYFQDETFFKQAPLRVTNEDERILLLFAHLFSELEDD